MAGTSRTLGTYKTKASVKKVMDGLVDNRDFIDEGVWHEMHMRSDHRPTTAYIHRKDTTLARSSRARCGSRPRHA